MVFRAQISIRWVMALVLLISPILGLAIPAALQTEILASRQFDASDENALVASAEFAAELGAWADRVNDERETAMAEGAVEHDAALEDAAERERAAAELEAILRRTSGP